MVAPLGKRCSSFFLAVAVMPLERIEGSEERKLRLEILGREATRRALVDRGRVDGRRVEDHGTCYLAVKLFLQGTPFVIMPEVEVVVSRPAVWLAASEKSVDGERVIVSDSI